MTFLKTLQDVKAHKNIYQNTTCSTQGHLTKHNDISGNKTIYYTKHIYFRYTTTFHELQQHFSNNNKIFSKHRNIQQNTTAIQETAIHKTPHFTEPYNI